jgi:hypothetical protein
MTVKPNVAHKWRNATFHGNKNNKAWLGYLQAMPCMS